MGKTPELLKPIETFFQGVLCITRDCSNVLKKKAFNTIGNSGSEILVLYRCTSDFDPRQTKESSKRAEKAFSSVSMWCVINIVE